MFSRPGIELISPFPRGYKARISPESSLRGPGSLLEDFQLLVIGCVLSVPPGISWPNQFPVEPLPIREQDFPNSPAIAVYVCTLD